MANRVQAAIVKMEKQIADRVASGITTLEKLKETSKKLDMDVGEYCSFQERKSLAFAEGKLTLDEANTVYGYLGNSPEHFNRQPVHVKYVLTSMFAELLTKRA